MMLVPMGPQIAWACLIKVLETCEAKPGALAQEVTTQDWPVGKIANFYTVIGGRSAESRFSSLLSSVVWLENFPYVLSEPFPPFAPSWVCALA